MKHKNHIPTNPSGDFLTHDNSPAHPARQLVAGLGMAVAAYTSGHVAADIIDQHQQKAAQEQIGAEQAAQRAAAEQKFQGLSEEAHAVANRYDACDITDITTVPNYLTTGTSSHPIKRDKLVLTLNTHRNDASKPVEAKYAENDTISWTSWPTAYIVGKDEQGKPKLKTFVDNVGKQVMPHTVEKETNKIALYPKADNYPLGTTMAVFASTQAETTSIDLLKTYQETDTVYCGSLKMTADPKSGEHLWTPAPDAPAFEGKNSVDHILLEQDPHSGVYHNVVPRTGN